jgi:SAM-dependent methyltransferase
MPLADTYFSHLQEELARQDNVHHMGHAILGAQFFGPVEYLLSTPPIQGGRRNVLEIGCGTGSWIRDMARMFPHVDFLGLDVLPTPPPADRARPVTTGGASGLLTRNMDEDDDTESVTEVNSWDDSDYGFSEGEDTLAGDGWGPEGWIELPNVKFLEKDVTEGLEYDDETFDVIHVRFVFSVAVRFSFAKPSLVHSWSDTFIQMAFHMIPSVLRSLTRVLRPGGLLLVIDSCVPFCMSDNSPLVEGSGTMELFHAVRNAVTEMGLDPDTRDKIVQLVTDTGGYNEIETKEVVLPLGPWPEGTFYFFVAVLPRSFPSQTSAFGLLATSASRRSMRASSLSFLSFDSRAMTTAGSPGSCPAFKKSLMRNPSPRLG